MIEERLVILLNLLQGALDGVADSVSDTISVVIQLPNLAAQAVRVGQFGADPVLFLLQLLDLAEIVVLPGLLGACSWRSYAGKP